ncbi:MAG: hypothetical protein AAFP90_11920, partial [Planctomycetota bacterium]
MLQSLIENYFATGFRDSAADRVTSLFPLGVVHVRLLLLQVVKRWSKVFFRAPETSAPLLLRCASDHFLDTAALVTQRVSLFFRPTLRLIGFAAKERS